MTPIHISCWSPLSAPLPHKPWVDETTQALESATSSTCNVFQASPYPTLRSLNASRGAFCCALPVSKPDAAALLCDAGAPGHASAAIRKLRFGCHSDGGEPPDT